LEDNSQRTKWKVISPQGNEAMVPSVCFTIPPPNQEAIDTASRYSTQMLMRVSHTHAGITYGLEIMCYVYVMFGLVSNHPECPITT